MQYLLNDLTDMDSTNYWFITVKGLKSKTLQCIVLLKRQQNSILKKKKIAMSFSSSTETYEVSLKTQKCDLWVYP